MFIRMDRMWKRLIALGIAVIMILGLSPISILADSVATFTVQLNPKVSGAIVKMTDKAVPANNFTTTTDIDGVAEFANKIDNAATYIVEVTGVRGFVDYKGESGISGTSLTVTMTEMDKVAVTGNVIDENGAPYPGADISFTGYTVISTNTDAKGDFQVQIYKNQTYTMTVTAGDKYIATNVTLDTSKNSNHNITLEPKTFTITTSAGSGGTITSSTSVIYGTDKIIEVISNDGYEIESLTIDGELIPDAKGKILFNYEITNITKDMMVSATFVRRSYEITVTYNENGTVTDGAGNPIGSTATLGGSISVQHGDNTSLRITPNTHYHVGSILVDGTSISLESDLNISKEAGGVYVYTFTNVTAAHSVSVTFDIDTYNITVSSTGSGTITVGGRTANSTEVVEYGKDITLKISPSDSNYAVSEILIDGSPVDLGTLVNDPDGSSYYTFTSVASNHSISATFVKVEGTTGDESNYYTMQVVKGVQRKFDTESGAAKTGIYSNDAEVKFIPVSPYTRINVYTKQNPKGTGFITGGVILSASAEVIGIDVDIRKGSKNDTLHVTMALPIKIIIDKTAPTITGITKESPDEWTNQSVTVKSTVTDTGDSGLEQVRYSKNLIDYTNDTYTNNTVPVASLIDGSYSFIIPDTAECNDIYYIWAYDLAGNKSAAKQVAVRIDKTSPTLADDIAKSPNSTWTKESVVVSGSAGDLGGAGVSEVRYGTSEADFINDSYKSNSASKAELNSDVYTFTVKNTAEFYGSYYVWAYDKAGNKSASYKMSEVNIDTTAPKVDSITKSPSTDWADGAVTITANVSDSGSANNSGIAGIRYSTTNNYAAATEITGNQASFTFTTPPDEFAGIYYIWTYDAAGNVSSAGTIDVNIDTKNPTISGFEIKQKNTSTPAKIINFLTFGTFLNETVEVTVTASDEVISSGVKSITLLGDGVEIETKSVGSGNKAVFTLTVPFNKVLSAIATDNVERKSAVTLATTVNSNIKDSRLMLEEVSPEITISPVNTASYTGKDNKKWYSGDASFTVLTGDTDSGIYDVVINLNEQSIKKDKNLKAIDADFSLVKTNSEEFALNTDQGNIKDDGSYDLSVTVTDNAGNVLTKSETVYKDTVSPDITGFVFATADGQKDGIPVQPTEYGFYFLKNTTVTITASDKAPASGVASITYYTVDFSNSKAGVKSADVTVAVDDNKISFLIPANFKGQIYARATDNVGNVAADFAKPDGTVIEDGVKHTETSSITLGVPAAPYKDNNGTDLYQSDVDVNVSVTDSYSGIKTIEWTVISPYDTGNNQNGTIDIDNKGDISGDKDGWAKTAIDINLVTELTKTIKVVSNSNDIKVKLKLTDRAGNSSEKEIKFSIDKTKPVINVTYDNNSYDEGFKAEREYYKANRTAKIVITERNFKPSDVITKITNTDGVIPVISSWTEVRDNADEDKTTYTATIDYVADGDYTFDISCTDLAGNAADPFAQHAFTMDKTLPVINVVYDNNSAQNVNYYKAQRTATITIKEHNFETSRINIAGTASDNGKPVTYPAVSVWSSSGDMHTAKITFASDALYSFDIDYTDKAGNKAADFAQQQFYVDKTVPALVISGVNDKSANKGNVIPIVTLSDTNYNKNNVSIKLTGSNRGPVSSIGSFADITNGQKYTFKNFEKKKEVDDLYTLAAVVVDMAGNRSEKTINFSVNRFGSVYTMGDILKNAEGKYVLKGFDVVIIETNVDNLKMDSIKAKITKNGTPIDLVMDKDFTVKPSGGDGIWSQYEYTIKSNVFEGDAKYMVTLHSVDAAGNVNENIDETKNAEIWFGVDKTMPVVVPINLEDKTTYAVDLKQASVSVSDNLVLSDVKVYLNDKEVQQSVSGDSYSFDIPGSTSSQRVRIVARDAAGNELVKEIKSFYVTTNIFVRWYTNTPLFIGTIVGVAVIAIGVTSLVLFRKKGAKVNNGTEGGDGNGN